jgi:alpha-methylacyl-CoA racemase
MTGWGQSGPLAHTAGHDINYLALTGGLHLIGERGRKPVPPLNIAADFGGGGMMLLAGMLAALLEAARSGKGQVIDAAMTDGVIALLSIMFSQRAAGHGFVDATGESLLAGAAPYYGTFETSDGKYLAIGSIEPQFYAVLVEKLGIDRKFLACGYPAGREHWPEAAAAIAAAVRTRTRDEWAAIFAGTDACVSPVLSLAEAAQHAHNVARGSFITVDGVEQHAPAPRFSRSTPEPVQGPHRAGADTVEVLREAGYSTDEIERLRAAGGLS